MPAEVRPPRLVALALGAALALTAAAPGAAQINPGTPALRPSLAPQPICGRPVRVEASSRLLHHAQRSADRLWVRAVAAALPPEFTRLSNADPARSSGRCQQLGPQQFVC
jgi:hypothetical protein